MLSSVQEGAPPFISRVPMEVKSDLAPHTHTHTQRDMHTVNASLNCIYPPKCASINPEGRYTEGDEDQCISVAVHLISEIRWRPFREMRTKKERRRGESVRQKVMGWILKEKERKRQGVKGSQKIRGEERGRGKGGWGKI